MNVVIIDSDCKKFFPDQTFVQNLLQDSNCKVYELEATQDLFIEEGCKCILLTSLHNGIRNYHRELILRHPQVRCWVFSIVNVKFESEQLQIRENLDVVLAETRVRYQVVFDHVETLERTAAISARAIPPKKCCLVVSRNIQVAQACCELLSRRLINWDVVYKHEHLEEFYEDADLVLAVGAKLEDYELLAPLNCMGRIYVWLEQSGFQDENMIQRVYEKLADQGWNLGSKNKIYSSNLQMETYALQLDKKELSVFGLKNIEEFVIWDMYGLPICNEDYTDEVIENFMQQHCCFRALTEKIL